MSTSCFKSDTAIYDILNLQFTSISELHLNYFTHVKILIKQTITIPFTAIFALAGFIDFIVYPTFSLLTDMAEKIVIPLVEENPGPPDPCNRHR